MFNYFSLYFFNRSISLAKNILLTIISGISFALFATLLTIDSIKQQGYFEGPVTILLITLNILIYALYSKSIFLESTYIQRLLIFCLASMLLSTIESFILFLLKISTIYIELLNFSMIFANLFASFLSYLSLFLLIHILEKARLLKYIKTLFDYPLISLVIILLFPIITIGLDLFTSSNPNSILIAATIYFSFIVLVSYLLYDISKKNKVQSSQQLLQQQKIYTEHLEKTQQEIDLIHQKYKTLVQELHQYSIQKNLIAVQETIHTEVLEIDQTIAQQIKQVNQLVKIEFIELKGLILTKIILAEKQGLNLFVEVQEPINSIAMDKQDILRCIGILLDNAIEETTLSGEQSLTLLLFKEQTTITIIVKNPCKHQPKLHKIWQEGYSTKGTDRGLGLSNLRQIISSYQNVFQDTRLEKNYFIQILMIQNT